MGPNTRWAWSFCVSMLLFLPLTVFFLSLLRVTSLSMSPVDDTFISGSLDKTSRLWDLRSPNCQVSLCLLSQPSERPLIRCQREPRSLQSHTNLSFAFNTQGLMHLQGKPVCSFDPEGLIFAAGINSEMVKLYDLRSFDKVRSQKPQEGAAAAFLCHWQRFCFTMCAFWDHQVRKEWWKC